MFHSIPGLPYFLGPAGWHILQQGIFLFQTILNRKCKYLPMRFRLNIAGYLTHTSYLTFVVYAQQLTSDRDFEKLLVKSICYR